MDIIFQLFDGSKGVYLVRGKFIEPSETSTDKLGLLTTEYCGQFYHVSSSTRQSGELNYLVKCSDPITILLWVRVLEAFL